jgi:hypothetical protein
MAVVDSIRHSSRAIEALTLVTLVAGSIAACASMPPKKQIVTKLAETAQLLGVARDAERSLCSATADKTQSVTHCDGNLAAAAGLTDDRHHRVERAVAAALDASSKATAAVESWKSGDPAPTALHDLIVAAQAALVETQALSDNPSVTTISSSLQQAIDTAASIQATLTAGT